MTSRSLSIATALEKSKITSGTPFLVTLEVTVIDPATGVVAEVLHLVNNSENINWRGVEYTAMRFDIQLAQESGAQPEVQLVFQDLSNFMQSRMQTYAGGVGFEVVVSVINSAQLFGPPEVQEFFQIIASESSNYQITFTLGAESALSKRFPRRRQMRDICAWSYKSEDCAYAGDIDSCDLTLTGPNGCNAHANSLNFGGFPGITAGAHYG